MAFAAVTGLVVRERRRLALWSPVAVGLGVWLWFLAPVEPPAAASAVALIPPLLLLAYAARAGRILVGAIAAALLLAAIGFSAASLRARIVAAPVLAAPFTGTVEGRVAELSYSRNNAVRVLLDDAILHGLERDRSPRRARVTLLPDLRRELRVGERIAVYVSLSPPAGAVEPGGFDFRRWAWFRSLGAVGFARAAVVGVESPPEEGPAAIFRLRLATLRFGLAEAIRTSIGGEAGAFSAALITGDRSHVSNEAMEALRDSNLAHLLSISGLHMGLVTALVFGLMRIAIALVPPLALRVPSKKVAAAVALVAALGYLAISGASIPTQRAFVMVAVALGAVLIDRPAITLRGLAMAALAVLLIMPEGLTDAGFQMSFAATAALVAAFEEIRRRRLIEPGPKTWPRRVALYIFALFVTSLVAGLATAPFSAANFNRVSNYGLVANMLAVPVTGLWVMPSAVAAGILAPIGLDGPALWAMGRGVESILAVARWVAGFDGAVTPVAAAPPAAIPLIALGGLWLCLWTRSWRLYGGAVATAALVLWALAPARPELLISARGDAIGLLTPSGRAVDRAVGESYAVTSWLERDGDGADQAEAAARPGLERWRGGAAGALSNGWRVVLLRRAEGRKAAEHCAERTLVIAAAAEKAPAGGCVFLGGEDFAWLGAVAVAAAGDGISLRGAATEAAGRYWGGGPGR